jgi:hypothetical protein
MTAPTGARCGFATNRDRENREHEENQKLTTMPRSWSERSGKVGIAGELGDELGQR